MRALEALADKSVELEVVELSCEELHSFKELFERHFVVSIRVQPIHVLLRRLQVALWVHVEAELLEFAKLDASATVAVEFSEEHGELFTSVEQAVVVYDGEVLEHVRLELVVIKVAEHEVHSADKLLARHLSVRVLVEEAHPLLCCCFHRLMRSRDNGVFQVNELVLFDVPASVNVEVIEGGLQHFLACFPVRLVVRQVLSASCNSHELCGHSRVGRYVESLARFQVHFAHVPLGHLEVVWRGALAYKYESFRVVGFLSGHEQLFCVGVWDGGAHLHFGRDAHGCAVLCCVVLCVVVA